MKTIKLLAIREGMDKNNKKGFDIMTTEGTNAAINYMVTHPEFGEKLNYAEIRTFYG